MPAIYMPFRWVVVNVVVAVVVVALAIEAPGDNRKVAMRALKIALKKHMEKEPPVYSLLRLANHKTIMYSLLEDVSVKLVSLFCSKSCHSLVELALQGSVSSELNGKEEAWAYFQDIIKIIPQSNVTNHFSTCTPAQLLHLDVRRREHIQRSKSSGC